MSHEHCGMSLRTGAKLMYLSFEEAAQAALKEALHLRATHGEPESIDIATYASEQSMRKAGINGLSLDEHNARAHHIAYILQEHGFLVKTYLVPEED